MQLVVVNQFQGTYFLNDVTAAMHFKPKVAMSSEDDRNDVSRQRLVLKDLCLGFLGAIGIRFRVTHTGQTNPMGDDLQLD